ncbi:MAG: DinB family protein [Desulfobulbaceae bacterium]|nr:DinB family protein [Desulfobulbaceae bacterium]
MAEATGGKEPGKTLRKQLAALLDGGNAHITFDLVMAEMPLAAANTRPDHFNYTPWQLLEHMRRAQLDVLNFIKDPGYESPPYAEFWPDPAAEATEAKWRKSVAGFRADLDEALEMVGNPETDFFSAIPHAPGYNILREILVIADHNAYHLGEFMAIRRFFAAAPPENW